MKKSNSSSSSSSNTPRSSSNTNTTNDDHQNKTNRNTSNNNTTNSNRKSVSREQQETAAFADNLKKLGKKWESQTVSRIFDADARLDRGEPPKAFEHIDLEEIDVNLFRARKETLWTGPSPPQGGNTRLYGGQLIGQGLWAATRTVEDDPASKGKSLHSLHCYFLAAGSTDTDVIYTVLPINTTRSFATRWVIASQRGIPIFTLQASYMFKEITQHFHQSTMPSVPPPEEIPTEKERYQKIHDDPRCPAALKSALKKRIERPNPIDMRYVKAPDYFGETQGGKKMMGGDGLNSNTNPGKSASESNSDDDIPTQIVWMKSKSKLGDDQNLHASVIAYCSDLALLATARGKQSAPSISMVASLDHAMWIHQECRADEWLLYVLKSPRAGSARALAIGEVFSQDGKLVVTVCQEGLMRFHTNSSKTSTSTSTTKLTNSSGESKM
jgi:acyl-CoA thioesterase II